MFFVFLSSIAGNVLISNFTEEVVEVGTCSSDEDCSNHGRCLNETVCECERGWTFVGPWTNTSKSCSYEQSSQRTAFFVSFFTGLLGTDWFYLSRGNVGYIILGILKLVVGLGCLGSWPLAYFGPKGENSEAMQSKLRGASTFFSLLAFAWWIVDWARVLGNKFPDGNGANLMPW